MLAWLRTGLGLLAFGFVLERVDGWLCGAAPPGAVGARPVGTAWIGATFIALGLLANGLAVVRFARIRRALKIGADLPTDVLSIAIAAGVTLLGAVLAVYVIAKLA